MIYNSNNISGINHDEITTDLILSKVTEYDIYKYYIGSDFKIGRITNSPLRNDNNPSFGIFKALNKSLLFKDQATGDSGNCITFVAKLNNISYKKAEKLIYKDIIANKLKISTVGTNIKEAFDTATMISIKKKNFTSTDDLYWGQFNIDRLTLKHFNVYPISNYWINDLLSQDVYSNINPIYAYQIYLKFKIYKPLNPNKKYKWVGNVGMYDIQGLEQLPLNGKLLIITKSLKDVMVLYKMGITAIAPQGEGHNIPDKIIQNLKNRFEEIIIFYDNDEAGIKASLKLTTKYNFKNILIDDTYNCKDISDFVKDYTFEKAKEWILQNLS
jgi:hypothetical protein